MEEEAMPLWGDPLDDLIDGLDRAIPPPADRRQVVHDRPPIEEIQMHVQIVLNGSEWDCDPDSVRM
jgi:hypothetical protein